MFSSSWENRHYGWSIKYFSSARSFIKKSIFSTGFVDIHIAIPILYIYTLHSRFLISSLNHAGLVFFPCESNM